MEAWRIYAAVTGCVAYGSTAGLFVSLLRDDETWLTEWLAASMVFMGQFAFIAFNVKTFPWRYSVLGRFRRTAAPSAPARYTAKNAGGIVGNMGSLFITWLVFDAGIELQIDICGKAFIPREAVVRLEPHRRRWVRLEHRSEEIRNPILMPQHVAAEFAKICPPQSEML